VAGQRGIENGVDATEAAGAVEDLLRGHVRVAGSEDMEETAVCHAGGNRHPRPINPGALLGADPREQRGDVGMVVFGRGHVTHEGTRRMPPHTPRGDDQLEALFPIGRTSGRRRVA
jgi:hypothetical protein